MSVGWRISRAGVAAPGLLQALEVAADDTTKLWVIKVVLAWAYRNRFRLNGSANATIGRAVCVEAGAGSILNVGVNVTARA